ncbi:hypothetical protein [Cryptosporangium arvum]|uniref:hypothetical protein n=1 Tax=Cryptosporangium arvum TaxID=80871 RepID=UPI0004B5A57E|nr:hypothetical protein [Cryptosporangium arvum]
MTQVAAVARRGTFVTWVWARAARVAAASAAWARAERHAFLSRPTAGAFHGEQPPPGGYLTQMRSTWGRP